MRRNWETPSVWAAVSLIVLAMCLALGYFGARVIDWVGGHP